MEEKDAKNVDVKSEDAPVTHTQPFGGDKDQKDSKPSDGKAELRAQAERSVRSQHGEFIHRNPNFERMVDEAEKQISGSIETNKDM